MRVHCITILSTDDQFHTDSCNDQDDDRVSIDTVKCNLTFCYSYCASCSSVLSMSFIPKCGLDWEMLVGHLSSAHIVDICLLYCMCDTER